MPLKKKPRQAMTKLRRASAVRLTMALLLLPLPSASPGQPPFRTHMFAIARTSDSIMGLSHQPCKYMKRAFGAETISWYASGTVMRNHACWAQSKKFEQAIDFCVFANLKQPPLCFPKAKSGFVDARDFHMPRGAFK